MAKVGIVMGSDSDMPVMAKAAEILDKFGIDYEMTIISAHREPDLFFKWAKAAEEKGFKVIIAGAGKAAHLPGMCAAIFPLPVIGIPMKTSDLGGVDSLYSIVQMPSGIPVATVAINGGANADLGITGNKGCHYLICASSIYQSQIDPLFLKIAKFNGSVLGGIKNGMCNFVKGHFFHFSACSTIHFPTSCKTACRKCSC